MEIIYDFWTLWFWEQDCPGADRNSANEHTKNSEKLIFFLLICFESLSLCFFMRNVNHVVKFTWINQAIALETRFPQVLLLNQTLVCSSSSSKGNLLTPGCGEGKCSVYCKVSSKELGQLVLKTSKLLDGFQQSIFKDQVRNRSPDVCDQLVQFSDRLMVK